MLNSKNFSIAKPILELKVSLDRAFKDLKLFSGDNSLGVTLKSDFSESVTNFTILNGTLFISTHFINNQYLNLETPLGNTPRLPKTNYIKTIRTKIIFLLLKYRWIGPYKIWNIV